MVFFFQAEDGIRDLVRSRGLGDVYKRQEQAAQELPNATMAMMPDLDHAQGFMLADQALPFLTEFLATANPEREAPVSALDAGTAAQIDAMVEETMTRINLPGFALAVVKDGEVAYAKGFGVTSLDGGEPVTAQTVFQWNETAMSLTAMAVMQLVEEGKIDLNAPVTDYVPYFCLLYTSPSPRDRTRSRMPSSACKKKKTNTQYAVPHVTITK